MRRRDKANRPVGGAEQPRRIQPQVVSKRSFMQYQEAIPLLAGGFQNGKAANGNGIRRRAAESGCDFNVPFPAKIEYADRTAGCARGDFYSLRENPFRAKRLRRGAQNEVCDSLFRKTLSRT